MVRIYVGNLPFITSDTELRMWFSECGGGHRSGRGEFGGGRRY